MTGKPSRNRSVISTNLKCVSRLLHEVRFIANLSGVAPPQILDIDSRGLAALLDHMADDLKAIRRWRGSWYRNRGDHSACGVGEISLGSAGSGMSLKMSLTMPFDVSSGTLSPL